MIASWPCPTFNSPAQDEYALIFDRDRSARLLVLPALFDEANKTRRQIAQIMRRLDHAGVDCFLPDLPGCNESLASLEMQDLDSWRMAAAAAAKHFEATHVLTIRAAAILAPPRLPGWRYAPTGGANALRALLRARLVAAREAGRDETMDGLTSNGRSEGLELAGYQLGQQMFTQLEAAHLPDSGILTDIDQAAIGGGGLWLRAEPGEAPDQADALAAFVAIGLAA